jgi:hypothetical protein
MRPRKLERCLLLADFSGFADPDYAVASLDPHSDPFLAFRNSDIQLVIDGEALTVDCGKNKRPERFWVGEFFEITDGHGGVLLRERDDTKPYRRGTRRRFPVLGASKALDELFLGDAV